MAPDAAGRLAGLARRQVAGQAVAPRPVGGGLPGRDHPAQRHPRPVLADPEEAGQADQLGHGQLGRVHAEQGAGQHGAGGERGRLLGATGDRGIT